MDIFEPENGVVVNRGNKEKRHHIHSSQSLDRQIYLFNHASLNRNSLFYSQLGFDIHLSNSSPLRKTLSPVSKETYVPPH